MRKVLFASALAACAFGTPARAQSLEETVLLLESGGAEFPTKREGPYVVTGGSREIRVLDPAACVVQVTDLDRTPMMVSGSWDESAPKHDLREFKATRWEYYLGRVVPAEVRKVPSVLGTRNGVVVEQIVDGKWRLAASRGAPVKCTFWPSQPKTCWETVEFDRILPVPDLPDLRQRTERMDRAVARLYGELCKGATP